MSKNALILIAAAIVIVGVLVYFVVRPTTPSVVKVDTPCQIVPPKDYQGNREVAFKAAADLSKLAKTPGSANVEATAKETARETFQLVPESDVACHMILETINCLSHDPRNQMTVQTLTTYIADKCGPQTPPKNAYQTRIQGQAAFVNGDQFDLDLGYVAAGTEQHIALDVISHLPRAPQLHITTIDQPLTVTWQDGAAAASATDQTPSVLILTIPPQDTNTDLRREVRVSAISTKPLPPLVIGVHLHSLPVTQTVTQHSGSKASGRGGDSSPTYSVCADAPTPGDYVHTGNRPWLTGDRVCNQWSTCNLAVDPSGKRACLNFTLQGHSECLQLFSHCDAIRDSEGHIEATFRLQPSTPTLRALGS